MRNKKKKLKHKIQGRSYEKLASSPYWIKPGKVFQFPGTRYGLVNETDHAQMLTPILFDKCEPDSDNAATT